MSIKIVFLMVATLLSARLMSQGCSDAGLCTAGSMKDNGASDEKWRFGFNTQYGQGDQKVDIFTQQIEISRRLSEKVLIQAKMPWINTSGNLGNNQGIGDLVITGNYKHRVSDELVYNVNLGFRLPTGNTNAGNIDIVANPGPPTSLPMPYQTGLGTFDVLTGMDIRFHSVWQFALGFQLPLIQNNTNNFNALYASMVPNASGYFYSANLKRQADIVARIEKKFELNKSIALFANIIPIYHVGDDEHTTYNGSKEVYQQSSGLTLNTGAGLIAELSKASVMRLSFAAPMITRKERPDGLTRHFVAGLEWHYRLFH
jgi:hypothetical protein